MSDVAVAGAGVAGLSSAIQLARAGHRVTTLDRVPVAGGILGYRFGLVCELLDQAQAAGVTMRLGTTALRWQAHRLLVAGPTGITWLGADHVVVCTGVRPRTLAELEIAGPRLAGVLPVTAAVHLLESGAHLGRRIVIIGSGWWARRLAEHVAENVGLVVVGPALDAAVGFPADVWSGWRAVSLQGDGRVTGVLVQRQGVTELISCDAVVVADTTAAYRNVDGALDEASDGVSFVQPAETTADGTVAACRTAAAAILDSLETSNGN